MLHVTNGDSARVRIERVVDGEVLPWRDVLHEGPVPDVSPAELRRVRARFLAGCGWAPESEALRGLEERDEKAAGAGTLCLWFEHDLYDQLQLLQVLDLARGQVELAQSDRYLGSMEQDEVAELYERRRPVTAEQRDLAARAWAAFRSPHADALEELAADDTSALPFLAGALRRHLAELPDEATGLALTERLVLDAVAAGASTFEAVFTGVQEREDGPIFMGDSVLRLWLERLEPLLGREPYALTDAGRAVRAGELRWRTPRRWLGGVVVGA